MINLIENIFWAPLVCIRVIIIFCIMFFIRTFFKCRITFDGGDEYDKIIVSKGDVTYVFVKKYDDDNNDIKVYERKQTIDTYQGLYTVEQSAAIACSIIFYGKVI